MDRLHFNEAWYSYARFKSLYKERFAMYGMLDPIKVSVLTSGMGDDGALLADGIPASVVTV